MTCHYYGCPYPDNPRYDHDHPADSDFQRWAQQAADRLVENGEVPSAEQGSADTPTPGEPHRVDAADRDSAGHGNKVA